MDSAGQIRFALELWKASIGKYVRRHRRTITGCTHVADDVYQLSVIGAPGKKGDQLVEPIAMKCSISLWYKKGGPHLAL
jgi:hypothetical protein